MSSRKKTTKAQFTLKLHKVLINHIFSMISQRWRKSATEGHSRIIVYSYNDFKS